MDIYYKSTRGKNEKITSSEAIVKGIASDGGLFIPLEFPQINLPLNKLCDMDYKELAFYIMKKYLTDFNDDELNECIQNAYNCKFDTPLIAPLVEKKGLYFLELYHGPTLAFKDMALSILPHLMKTAMRKLNINREIVILTATSGDTGKAALEGFADVEGTKIIVFYPKDGVSEIQKRQMITQSGNNTFVIGIEGNFDDAQNGVKKIFRNKELNRKLREKNYSFSSANSINIGRLIPQIVYYVYSYLNLLKHSKIQEGEKINIVVPTGNFGNILAAYYARKMGLPVNKFICASNENNVLYDFINTGVYDRRRELVLTSSPSMDILVSSNLERLLYELSSHDEEYIRNMMQKLEYEGKYEVTNAIRKGLKDFYGGFASEEETYEVIREVYYSMEYVIDPHTAVAYCVYKKYLQETNDKIKTVIASTASPFKFTKSVYKAVTGKEDIQMDDLKLIYELSNITGLVVPKAIEGIENRRIVHDRECKADEMKNIVEEILIG